MKGGSSWKSERGYWLVVVVATVAAVLSFASGRDVFLGVLMVAVAGSFLINALRLHRRGRTGASREP